MILLEMNLNRRPTFFQRIRNLFRSRRVAPEIPEIEPESETAPETVEPTAPPFTRIPPRILTLQEQIRTAPASPRGFRRTGRQAGYGSFLTPEIRQELSFTLNPAARAALSRFNV